MDKAKVVLLIAKKINEMRLSRKLSQNEIAKVLGISQQTYSRYETGVNEIPVHHIVTLANYYNTSADYILGISKDNKK